MLYECAAITAPTVRVVTNSALASGVDAYFSLKNGTQVLSFGPMLGEALAAYLEAAVGPDGLVRFCCMQASSAQKAPRYKGACRGRVWVPSVLCL